MDQFDPNFPGYIEGTITAVIPEGAGPVNPVFL
jgi:hypothetical protein